MAVLLWIKHLPGETDGFPMIKFTFVLSLVLGGDLIAVRRRWNSDRIFSSEENEIVRNIPVQFA